MTGQPFTLQTHAAGNRTAARRIRATRPASASAEPYPESWLPAAQRRALTSGEPALVTAAGDQYPAHWLPPAARRALTAGSPRRHPSPFGG